MGTSEVAVLVCGLLFAAGGELLVVCASASAAHLQQCPAQPVRPWPPGPRGHTCQGGPASSSSHNGQDPAHSTAQSPKVRWALQISRWALQFSREWLMLALLGKVGTGCNAAAHTLAGRQLA